MSSQPCGRGNLPAREGWLDKLGFLNIILFCFVVFCGVFGGVGWVFWFLKFVLLFLF